MVNWYRSDTLDQMYWHIYNDIVTNGDVRETRGTKSYELSNVAVEQVQNPHLFSLPLLHNKCLSYGELMLILAGNNDLRAYTFYSPVFKQWGVDGKMPGAYGERFDLLTVRRIVNRLKRDKHSRRAVIAIYNNKRDINVTGKMIDVVCNLALHFVPGDGYLDLNVFARSTDFRKGFVYDMGMWSLLLHYVSGALGLSPGELMFFTSSLHVYESDKAYLNRHNGCVSDVLQPQPESWTCILKDIEELVRLESNVRENESLGNLPKSVDSLRGHPVFSKVEGLHLYTLLPLIQMARNRKSVKHIEPYFEHPLWELNREYYDFAAGSLLGGQR